MDQLVVTLIVIMLPGIIAAVMCDKITVHSKWTPFKFSLYAFVLGISCFVLLQIVNYFIDIINNCLVNTSTWTDLKVWNSFVADNPSIPGNEITYAVVLSVPVALFASYLINHKIINKIAQALNVSSKYGDENLYSYYLNAKEIDWIYVRDIENGITYQGRVVSYSENEFIQELVMSEVTVFRYQDSSRLYSVPTIYLTKKAGEFIIEAIPEQLLGEY